MQACARANHAEALYNALILPSLRQAIRPNLSLRRPVIPTKGYPVGRLEPCTSSRRQPFHSSSTLRSRPKAPAKNPRPTNGDIPARFIQLVDADGSLQPPQTLWDTLRSFDEATHRLDCLVNVPGPLDRAASEFIPPCRIIDKVEEFKVAQEKRQAKKLERKSKAGAEFAKSLELNWAIDHNDLGHRLKRLQEFLEEGRRVEILLATKKKGRKATSEECNNVMERITKTVEDVKGARELRPMEGKLGAVVTLAYQRVSQ